MTVPGNKINFFRLTVSLILLTLITFTSLFAKSKPIINTARQLAFKRAKSLNNGISISGLEQTWNKQALNIPAVTAADLKLLKKLGFKSVRLPVAFAYFQHRGIPLNTLFNKIDAVLKLCKTYDFRLVIDYHYGNLADSNYVTETREIIGLWRKIAQKYLHKSPDFLLYEIYNEPLPINPRVWKDASYNIVTAIRAIDKKRTLIVGASNYNSIYELSRFVRLADENIIYTFHFYEPFLFTHQGAQWVGRQVATIGVPFPYSAENFPELNTAARNTWGETNYNKYKFDGNEQSVFDKLAIPKQWADKYGVPVYAASTVFIINLLMLPAAAGTLKRYAVRLSTIKYPAWDYNSTFSIFNSKPSIRNLPACMGYDTDHNAKIDGL